MNKTIVLLISMLVTVTIFGMHPQHQHQHQHPHQHQKQQKKDTKKQRWHSNDNDKQISSEKPQSIQEDSDVADLLFDISAIVKSIEKNDGSVDNHIQNTQKVKRIMLCPVCGDPICPWSKEVYE